MAAEEKAFLL